MPCQARKQGLPAGENDGDREKRRAQLGGRRARSDVRARKRISREFERVAAVVLGDQVLGQERIQHHKPRVFAVHQLLPRNVLVQCRPYVCKCEVVGPTGGVAPSASGYAAANRAREHWERNGAQGPYRPGARDTRTAARALQTWPQTLPSGGTDRGRAPRFVLALAPPTQRAHRTSAARHCLRPRHSPIGLGESERACAVPRTCGAIGMHRLAIKKRPRRVRGRAGPYRSCARTTPVMDSTPLTSLVVITPAFSMDAKNLPSWAVARTHVSYAPRLPRGQARARP